MIMSQKNVHKEKNDVSSAGVGGPAVLEDCRRVRCQPGSWPWLQLTCHRGHHHQHKSIYGGLDDQVYQKVNNTLMDMTLHVNYFFSFRVFKT